MHKIVDGNWIIGYPITSGDNKSCKATLESLLEALQNIYIKDRSSVNDLESFLRETEFFKTFPMEFYSKRNRESFALILEAYASDGRENFSEEDFRSLINGEFYLWFEAKSDVCS